MGRIVKGARFAVQAYQVKPPQPERPAVAPVFEDAVAPAPAIDLVDVRAQADRIVEDASERAGRLVAEAERTAGQLVTGAQRRVEEIEAAAQRSGYDRGIADGRAAAQTEMDDMLETMRGLLEMARIERHKIIESAEPEIVRLSVAIAERILNAHVAVSPSAVLEMAKSAITRLVNRETVTVRVNPADIATMREHRDGLMAMNDIDNLRVIEDNRVDRGGVLIETQAGTIDAKIATQLREVRRLLAVEEPMSVTPSIDAALIAPAQAS